MPIDVLVATGYPASYINSIKIKYSISQERYGIFSSAGTVATGYKNSAGSFQQVKNHEKGIGKGVDNYKSYEDEIIPYFSGNVATIAMKITNVIAAQTCYYRIKSVSFVIDYTIPTYTVTVKSSPAEGGTVSGGGSYESGKSATLKATPKTGYRFVKWNDDVTTNPRTITVTGNATYTAYFEQIPPPKFTSVEIKYLDKQVSPSNKVIVNESFIISVSVT